jgi:hypothetical protein
MQLKFFVEQKEARETLLKRRRQAEEKPTTNMGDITGKIGLARSAKLPPL